ncbi:putative hydrolase of the HAD superfamily [Natronoarchaeum philippinense]|uniref:Putative hydrolase of the HAD superfamily n=1 Tax=Natronoarchaeum philippinense TaxID=558529 RepID=A0A285N0I8_NATPI|nr:HAD family hydrolase [Natronoarchaeum philippinense]SNZ02950.1 putative hydrolase of the HAD superfamily [Natronoarchaeum philippinense]
MTDERAIVFDLDGTLLHYTRDFEAVLSDAVDAVDGDVPDGAVDAYSDAFFERFEACEPEPSLGAFEAIGGDADPRALRDSLRQQELDMCQPHEDAAADLDRLSETFEIGVLTNGIHEWQRHKLEAYDLDEYVDAFVASYEVGAHKPDVAPFRYVEERLDADKHAMVGDDDADVAGARAAGWTAYRYDGDGFGDLPDAIEW